MIDNLQKNPLVSVIVITYNSSDTVLDTLNSIKEQTYKEIELIISDDKSADNTVDICKGWISCNRSRFLNCEIVVPMDNTGTSANCNRGIKVSKGEWLRIIAGDDLMTPMSIEWQIDYVKKKQNVKILIGYYNPFFVKKGKTIILPPSKNLFKNKEFFNKSALFQYNYILRHYDFALTQGTIIHRKVYDEVTLYDEKYTIIEDLPFWLNVTKYGIKYYYIDKPLQLYRIHSQGITNLGDAYLANKSFWDMKRLIISDMIKPNIQWYEIMPKLSFLVDDLLYFLIFRLFNNKRSFITSFVVKCIYKLKTCL